MINIPFLMQTTFCQIAGSYFFSQNIGVFYTIPPKTSIPYIKISQLSVLKQEHSNPNIVAVQLGLTVYTNGSDNSQLLSIIQALDSEVVPLLNGSSDNAKIIIIQNAYINNWKINEIIDRRCWVGTCDMVIIGMLLSQ